MLEGGDNSPAPLPTKLSPTIVKRQERHLGSLQQWLSTPCANTVSTHIPQHTIEATPMGKIAHSYMEEEGVWIVPKQNKIHVGCKLGGELAQWLKGHEAVFIQVGGVFHAINRLMFAIDGMRVVGGRVSNERAPLFTADGLKQLVVPDVIYVSPISSTNLNSDIEAAWYKLQFTSPTIGNSDKSSPREKFHFVISLIAEANVNGQTMNYIISAVISPALIVIGQNPARFKRSKLKQQNACSLLPSQLLSASPPSTKRRRSDSPPSVSACNPNLYHNPPPTFVPIESLRQHNIPTFSLPSASPLLPIPSQGDFLTSQNPYLTSSPQNAALTLPLLPPQSCFFPSANSPTSLVDSLTPPSTIDLLTPPPTDPLIPSSPTNAFAPSSPNFRAYSALPLMFDMPTPTSNEYAEKEHCCHACGMRGIEANFDGKDHILSGKVGINHQPLETLTVGGSIFYTGDLIKPSDRRIKRNITLLHSPTKPNEHRDNISAIKLYQYERVDLGSTDIRYIKERGVVAQEVQEVIPTAVVKLNDTTLPDGTVVQNLLAVNERDLLIETIGATQELSSETDSIQKEVQYLSSITKQHGSILQTLASAISSVQRTEKANGSSLLSISKRGRAETTAVGQRGEGN